MCPTLIHDQCFLPLSEGADVVLDFVCGSYFDNHTIGVWLWMDALFYWGLWVGGAVVATCGTLLSVCCHCMYMWQVVVVLSLYVHVTGCCLCVVTVHTCMLYCCCYLLSPLCLLWWSFILAWRTNYYISAQSWNTFEEKTSNYSIYFEK